MQCSLIRTPVVLIVFNRREVTRIVFERIRQVMRGSKLYTEWPKSFGYAVHNWAVRVRVNFIERIDRFIAPTEFAKSMLMRSVYTDRANRPGSMHREP